MKEKKTYRLVVTAMLIAIATVLNQFAVVQLPFGGGVSIFSQVPIITIGYMFGSAWGVFGAFVFSLFQFIFGLSNLAYVKGILSYVILIIFDYILPYTVLGLGASFKGSFKKPALELIVGTIFVCFARFICHFISGATIWASYSNGNSLGAICAYSAVYNAGYMVPETIVTIIGLLALLKFVFSKLDKDGVIK